MNTPPSLLFWVGEDSYTLAEVVSEYVAMGSSKRIPTTAIPQGLVRGVSKLFFAHAKAILKVKQGCTLEQLVYSLLEKDVLTAVQVARFVDLDIEFNWGTTLQPNDFVPEPMLTIAMGLSKLPDKDRKELEVQYGIEYYPGIFGYSHFTGIQYVCRQGEDDLPEELKYLEGYVEPVKIVYEDEEGKDQECQL